MRLLQVSGLRSVWIATVAVGLLLAGLLAPSSVGQVQAEQPPACGGKNLLEELRAKEPEAYDKIRESGRQLANGQALFWRVVPPNGARASYLFGTVHVTDSRVLNIPSKVAAALDHSKSVALEIVDITPEGVSAAMMSLGAGLVFTDGRTLMQYLTDQEAEVVRATIAKQGMPAEMALALKPWIVSAMMALPDCEQARTAAGLKALDITLEERAEANGIATHGLETLRSQFEAMASLPLDAQVNWLKSSIALRGEAEDTLETLIQLYLDREIGAVWELNRYLLEEDPDLLAGIDQFELALIDKRNRDMVRNARPLIDAGGAFVAVGALHLPGENGVVKLLQDAGYEVTAAE